MGRFQPAEIEHGIGDAAAIDVDHEVLDFTDVLAFRIGGVLAHQVRFAIGEAEADPDAAGPGLDIFAADPGGVSVGQPHPGGNGQDRQARQNFSVFS